MGLIRLGRLIELAAVASDGALPTELRLFHAGVNETNEGPMLFDDKAAASVMAEFEQNGVDLMIDLAHISVDDSARVLRTDADDARGWCRLEVRPGPELWAVGMAWTPDGTRRLTERTQRYISPVVFREKETNRVMRVFNLALCSMPATYHASPLVAARKQITAARAAAEDRKPMSSKTMLARAVVALATAGDESVLVALEMTPEQAKKAIAAVKEQSGDAALALVESLLADALGAGGMGDDEPPAEPLEDAPPEPAPEDEKAAMAALRSMLRVHKGVDLVGEVKRLTSEVAAIRLEREAETRNERLDLVGELVKLGAELPSTAWKDPDKREPVESLATMPMAALRSRVAAFRAAPRVELKAPEGEAVELTAKERELASKMTDEQRARFLEARNARRAQ